MESFYTSADTDQLREPFSEYRMVYLSAMRGVAPGEIHSMIEKIGKYISYFHWHGYQRSVERISLFGPGFRLVPNLKKFRLDNSAKNGGSYGDEVVTYLSGAPSLEEVVIDSASFLSRKPIERFLTTTPALKKLYLGRGVTATKRAANGLFRGLSQNRTLVHVHLKQVRADKTLLPAIFAGIARNQTVQSLVLPKLGLCPRSRHPAVKALHRLLEHSKSIQSLSFGGGITAACVFHGLATKNCNIRALTLEFSVPDSDDASDNILAIALTDCFRKNKSVTSLEFFGFDVRAPWWGEASQAALVDGLARWGSLGTVSAHGCHVPSLTELWARSLWSGKLILTNQSLHDWSFLSNGLPAKRSQFKSQLQELDLSGSTLATSDLINILPRLANVVTLEELRMKDCGVVSQVSPLFAKLIKKSRRLRFLDLHNHKMGTQGAVSILQAVLKSTSMRHLDLGRDLSLPPPEVDSDEWLDWNDCHEALRDVVAESHLTELKLQLPHNTLGRVSIASLADGLRGKSTSLRTINLPWLDSKFVHILGEALTENSQLEVLDVRKSSRLVNGAGDEEQGGDALGDDEATTEAGNAAEDSAVSFIELLPRMKGLRTLVGILDSHPSERVHEALSAATQENTTLQHIPHVSSEMVQFHLSLNRLGRGDYLAMPANDPVQDSLLPLIFARMSGPECASQLFYFLRRKAERLTL